MKRYFDGTWTFGTAKLVHKFNKWFLHIPMTKDVAELTLADVNHVVGIDLGVNFLATTYDSRGKTTFYSGREVKHRRGQYKALRKELWQKQTSASRKRIKMAGSRENRYVTDVNHQVTKALVEHYPQGTCFVLEDLTGIRVNPKYTSRTCPRWGHREKENRNKKTHTFCCKKCHYTSNDDRIGAMNLHRKGIEAIV